MSSPKKKIELLFLCLIVTGFTNLISCSSDEESLSNDILNEAKYARSMINEAPVAKVSASELNGTVPLEVTFVSKSTDDRSVRSYDWDFGTGIPSSKQKKVVRTFIESGAYHVKLTVHDAQGLSSSDTVTIMVNSKDEVTQVSEPPKALAMANVLTGYAPLKVDFVGSNSTDDRGTMAYSWDFDDGSLSNEADTVHTFGAPGIFEVVLTVTDDEGQKDTAVLTITVNQDSSQVDSGTNLPCGTGTGAAGETGPKVWCWENVNIPSSGFFSNYELFINSHCNSGMVTKSGDRLYFKVNPTSPAAPSSCNADYNYRAEIRDHPSDVDHPVGTEQWWGFDYEFGNDYIPDELPWIFWQVHGSFSSPSNPMLSLQCGPTNYGGGGGARGEVSVCNYGIDPNRQKVTPTGIVPKAGQSLKIVIHVIWGDSSNGLYEVWINGAKVYSERERTVYASQPEGGYWKLGIYKWRWKSKSNVDASSQRGISELNTSIGTLRTIMRKPGEVNYGKNAFSQVTPD